MSCNACRVLRKGCGDECVLRPSVEWIESPQAQAHATVFVAKFYGRACLVSLLSNVPSPHRPALFRSLLYDACGRTINPVIGAVGLLWTGNWDLCQAAVKAVLSGGAIRPLPELAGDMGELYGSINEGGRWPASLCPSSEDGSPPPCDLDLSLMPRSPSTNSEGSVTTSAGGEDRTAGKEPRLLVLFS
ncbi:LOB domain-containing protein 37-like [Typha latifolia]|uniref:LOB domain-containing protein 37-like n=1 Tax=Typha latifolia TaxID=4733 RepID=UPI003C2DA768